MLLRLDADKPDKKRLHIVIDCLISGGIIIYPTDTVYTMGCDINNIDAHERICKLKGIKLKESNLSIVCYDLSHLTDYALPIETSTYRVMKKALPGPFTFILKANKQVSKLYGHSKATIGFRIPNHNIPRSIVAELGRPILSASIKNEDAIIEYIPDPEQIHDIYGDNIDIVIDGGWGGIIASTIVDFSDRQPVILREGVGVL